MEKALKNSEELIGQMRQDYNDLEFKNGKLFVNGKPESSKHLDREFELMTHKIDDAGSIRESQNAISMSVISDSSLTHEDVHMVDLDQSLEINEAGKIRDISYKRSPEDLIDQAGQDYNDLEFKDGKLFVNGKPESSEHLNREFELMTRKIDDAGSIREPQNSISMSVISDSSLTHEDVHMVDLDQSLGDSLQFYLDQSTILVKLTLIGSEIINILDSSGNFSQNEEGYYEIFTSQLFTLYRSLLMRKPDAEITDLVDGPILIPSIYVKDKNDSTLKHR